MPRIKVLKFRWSTLSAKAQVESEWPDDVFTQIFAANNSFSLREYWRRVTYQLLIPDFDIERGYRESERDQGALGDSRRDAIAAFKERAATLEIDLSGFHGVVVMAHPPPVNAGASGRDALLDQGGYMDFFAHEIGHVLGFTHPWGRRGEYDDPFCVMGFSLSNTHLRPGFLAEVPAGTFSNPDFLRLSRRVSGASLYRYFTKAENGGSGDLRSGRGAAGRFDSRVAHVQLGASVALDPMSVNLAQERFRVAVAPVPRGGVLTVEHRTAQGDDAGIGSHQVVVHTIGTRPMPVSAEDRTPAWFEGACAAKPGSALNVRVSGQVYRVTVTAVKDQRAHVTLTREKDIWEPGSVQYGWRRCTGCAGLAYSYGAARGACVADEAGHLTNMSEPHAVIHGAQPAVHEAWLWCSKCQVLHQKMQPPGRRSGEIVGLSVPIGGRCPAGAQHSSGGSALYQLFADVGDCTGQTWWVRCRKCYQLAYFGGAAGVCPSGGHHVAAGPQYSVMPETGTSAVQSGWRWCKKCQTLAFSRNGAAPCAAGGTHDHTGSRSYGVLWGTTPKVQIGWRWCSKCNLLTWSAGACAAGGEHARSGSAQYSLPMNLGLDQRNWRWCRWCQALFFAGADEVSRCPAEPTSGVAHHDFTGSHDYSALLEQRHVW